MITVANRTETAARIKYAFDHKRIQIDELCIPEYTLHIDSKTLEMAEEKISNHEEILNSLEDDEENIKLNKKELVF